MAGTVGGRSFGVAKNVRLVAVRVFTCKAEGTVGRTIAGVDWVTRNAVKPAVANMSLSAKKSSSLDSAVSNSVLSGITYVVAAGNDNGDACGTSPAREHLALTVGATTASDRRASFSNWGPCLDLFAPGVHILSAGIADDTAELTASGTSMAAPHVAGAAALVLAAAPGMKPREVAEILTSNSPWGQVIDPGRDSPNRLLHFKYRHEVAAVARNADGRLEVFRVPHTPQILTSRLSHRWQKPDGGWTGWTTFGGKMNAVAAETNGDGRIEVFGIDHDRRVWHRWQQPEGGWSDWAEMGGTLATLAVARNAEGRLEIVGANEEGRVWHRWQQPGGGWSDWADFGGTLKSVAAETNGDGRIEIFGVNDAGQVWHRWQKPEGGWTDWNLLDGSLATVAAARNADGRLEVFGVNDAGQVFHRWQQAGGGWSGWVEMGGWLNAIAAETNRDGRIEVFGSNATGQRWHRWQQPEGGWTNWEPFD